MINLLELGLLAFAGYRATQLVVHDAVLDPVRDPVFAWHDARPDSRPRIAMITLLSCTYCVGWWISGGLLAAYLLAAGQWAQAPLAVHGIEWLAVAGAAALLNRWDDTRQAAS